MSCVCLMFAYRNQLEKLEAAKAGLPWLPLLWLPRFRDFRVGGGGGGKVTQPNLM